MLAEKLRRPLLQFEFKNQINKELSEFSEINILNQIFSIAFDWAVILGAIAISQFNFNIPIYIVAVLIIAGRQHALLAIMHDAAHLRISKNHIANDLLGNYFAAFPILAATEWYREHHGKHHRFLNTNQDPDWSRKITLEEWKFPQKISRFVKTMISQFLIGGYEWLTLMVNMSGLFPLSQLNNRQRLVTLAHKISYYIVVLSVIFYFGHGHTFLMYWLVPLLVVFPALQRIRSISEHFGLAHTHELNDTRNLEANWFEKALFAPHNINYHLVHHMYPGIPQYNLKKLHQRLLMFEEYKEHAHQNDSYLFASPKSLLKDIIKPNNK